jgi:hypothetical protein
MSDIEGMRRADLNNKSIESDFEYDRLGIVNLKDKKGFGKILD